MAEDTKQLLITVAGIVAIIATILVFSYTDRAGTCIKQCETRPDVAQYQACVTGCTASYAEKK